MVRVRERVLEPLAAEVPGARRKVLGQERQPTIVDVVFASNLLEHLSREDIAAALDEFRRVLRPGGRLILIQPNYRLCARQYFDDYTHLTPLSDRSLADLLRAHDFDLLTVRGRFLPLTLKSSGGRLTFLLPLYLRLPVRPLAGQMLLVATPSRT